ncbi:MAG TPA: PLP-dependent transferase [Acidimicrobiia bacterium]|nr:PLP-dependent transferase [Acidimicrobiia bacterium]
MQLGLNPYLRKQLRLTGFTFELGETPGMMVPSPNGWAGRMPNHIFAAATYMNGVALAGPPDKRAASIDKDDLFEALHRNKRARSQIIRDGYLICTGWTTYPRFAPSIQEIRLVNHYFRKTAALPCSSRQAAQATVEAFEAQHPNYKDELRVTSKDNGTLFFVELINVTSKTGAMFNALREVREYLGTGMSAREAMYHTQRRKITNRKNWKHTLSQSDLKKLSDSLDRTYREQFAQLLKGPEILSESDIFVRANATTALVDVLDSIKSATGKKVLSIATSGVPYSDTPITMEMVAGKKPTNTRSQKIDDVIKSAKGADVVFVELGDNPKMEATDLVKLNAWAERQGVPIIVDVSSLGSGNVDFTNLFALKMVVGATISTTKYSSGTVMGGVFIRNPHCSWQGLDKFTEELKKIGQSIMFWADTAVHVRDLPTYNDRLRNHSANAQQAAELLSGLPGVQVSYPTENGSKEFIDPFLREGAGYGGLLSVQFDRNIYSEQQIVEVVNRLDEYMVTSLSFGLPFNNALAYPATVFPGQPESQCGLDVLTLRIGLGPNKGDGYAAYDAVRSVVTAVMGVDFLQSVGSPVLALA